MFFRPIRVGIELQVCLKKKIEQTLLYYVISVFFILMITFLLCVSKTQSSAIMPIVTSQRAARPHEHLSPDPVLSFCDVFPADYSSDAAPLDENKTLNSRIMHLSLFSVCISYIKPSAHFSLLVLCILL